MDAAHFTGKAGSHPLLPASASFIRFEPGARNHWHATRADSSCLSSRAKAGCRGEGQVRLVVNIGETHWLEESPPPPG